MSQQLLQRAWAPAATRPPPAKPAGRAEKQSEVAQNTMNTKETSVPVERATSNEVDTEPTETGVATEKARRTPEGQLSVAAQQSEVASAAADWKRHDDATATPPAHPEQTDSATSATNEDPPSRRRAGGVDKIPEGQLSAAAQQPGAASSAAAGKRQDDTTATPPAHPERTGSTTGDATNEDPPSQHRAGDADSTNREQLSATAGSSLAAERKGADWHCPRPSPSLEMSVAAAVLCLIALLCWLQWLERVPSAAQALRTEQNEIGHWLQWLERVPSSAKARWTELSQKERNLTSYRLCILGAEKARERGAVSRAAEVWHDSSLSGWERAVRRTAMWELG